MVVPACIPDLPDDGSLARCGDGIIDLNAGETCDPGPGVGTGSCSECQIQCSGKVWSANNHCYLPSSSSPPKFTDALCPANGHVATFASGDEFNFVKDQVYGGAFWIGLQKSKSRNAPSYSSVVLFEPGWSVDCPGCYANTLTPNAALPKTQNVSGAQDCVVAGGGSPEWRQYPCSTKTPPPQVICEFEPVGKQSRRCNEGICMDLVKTHGGKLYVLQGTELLQGTDLATEATADEASARCARLGGRLVVLQSREEREQLWHELSRLDVPPRAVWIGLSFVQPPGSTGSWQWDDGAPVDQYPPQWAANQPRPPVLQSPTPASTRAFLWKDPHRLPQVLPPSDDTLARNEPPPTTLPFVCEIALSPRPGAH
jgi:hypothetical protein